MSFAAGFKPEQTNSVYGVAPLADEQGEQHFYVTGGGSLHAPQQQQQQLHHPQQLNRQPTPQHLQPLSQHHFQQQPQQHFHQSHPLHQPHIQHLHQPQQIQSNQQLHFHQQRTLLQSQQPIRPPNLQPLHHQHSHLHHHQHLHQQQQQQRQQKQQYEQHIQSHQQPHPLFDNNSLQDTRQLLHQPHQQQQQQQQQQPLINLHQVTLEIERIETEIKSITESITDGSLSFTDKNIRNLLINLNTNLRNQQNIFAKLTARQSSAATQQQQLTSSSQEHLYQPPTQLYRQQSPTPLQTPISQQHQTQIHPHTQPQLQSHPLLQPQPQPQPQPQCIRQPQPQIISQPHPHIIQHQQSQIHHHIIQQPLQQPPLVPRQEQQQLELDRSVSTKLLNSNNQKQTELTDCSEVITISSSDDAEDELDNQEVPTNLGTITEPNQTVLVGESTFNELEKLTSPQPHAQPSSRQPSPQPQPQPTRQPSPQPSEQPPRDPTPKPSQQSPEHHSPQPQKSEQPQNSQESQAQQIAQPQPLTPEQPQTAKDNSPQPSEQPSKQPPKHPSPQPSEQPQTAKRSSPRPSEQPSPQPSEQPSKQPHSHPSRQSQERYVYHQQQSQHETPKTPKTKNKKNKKKKNKNKKHHDRQQSRHMIEPKRESQSSSHDRPRMSSNHSQQARAAILHDYLASRRKKRIKKHAPLSSHAKLKSRGFDKLELIENHRNNQRGVTLFDVYMRNRHHNKLERCELIASELIKFSYSKVHDYVMELNPFRKTCMEMWSPIITLIGDYRDKHELVVKEIKRLQNEMVKISKKAQSKIYPERSIKMRILREKRNQKLKECQARLRERGIAPTSLRPAYEHGPRSAPRSPPPQPPSSGHKQRARLDARSRSRSRSKSRSRSPRRNANSDFLLEGMQKVKREH